jgi:hypothetical protein
MKISYRCTLACLVLEFFVPVPFPAHLTVRSAMVKFLKEKKVVIILNGRYAGKKAVIVETFEKYVRCVLL